jgi:hypothetical protein
MPADGKMVTNRHVLLVRRKIAELSDEYGPTMARKKLEGVGVKSSHEEPKKPDANEAEARRKKLKMAEDMPPDVSRMKSDGSDDGVITAEKAAELTEEEYAALPQSVRDKILGKT